MISLILFVFLLIIFILMFLIFIYNIFIEYETSPKIIFNELNATVITIYEELVEIESDTNIPCGVYSCNTNFGRSLIFHNDKTYIYNVFPPDMIISGSKLFISSVSRLSGYSNDVVNTFNRGC